MAESLTTPQDERYRAILAEIVLSKAIETNEKLDKIEVNDATARDALLNGFALNLGKAVLEYTRGLKKK